MLWAEKFWIWRWIMDWDLYARTNHVVRLLYFLFYFRLQCSGVQAFYLLWGVNNLYKEIVLDCNHTQWVEFSIYVIQNERFGFIYSVHSSFSVLIIYAEHGWCLCLLGNGKNKTQERQKNHYFMPKKEWKM